MPGSGKIEVLKEPDQGDGLVRIDTGVREGDEISIFYDPMISKLIVRGSDRIKTIKRMSQALDEYAVVGLPTNIKFLKRVVHNKQFMEGTFDTSFIPQNEQELLGKKGRSTDETERDFAAITLVHLWFENEKNRKRRVTAVDPWSQFDNFRVNHHAKREVKLIEQDGETTHIVEVEYLEENKFNVSCDRFQLKNVEIFPNKERENEMIICTPDEQFKCPYILDEEGHVTCLDHEGDPLIMVIHSNSN